MLRYSRLLRLSVPLLLLSACPRGGGTPAVDSIRHDDHVVRDTGFARYDAATFFETVSVGGASFSHDEASVLTSMDTTGIFNVYSLPIGKGEAAQMTRSQKETVFSAGYFPADNRFLYTSDSGGNERNHLFVMNLDGTSRDLTPGDDVKAGFLGWSGDDSSFWVMTNERDKQSFDLYRYAADSYERTLVFKNESKWVISGVSPDGRWITMGKVNSNSDSDIYIHDATRPDGEPKLITSHQGAAEHRYQTFTRDSGELVYTTDAHSEFYQAWTYDLNSGEHKLLHAASWDVLRLRYSHAGTYMLVVTNEDARTVVRVLHAATGKDVDLPELPEGEVLGGVFARSEKLAAMYISRDRSSPDLYVVDMHNKVVHRMTDTMNKAIDPDHLVDGRVVRYKSFDGLEIPAILYRPKGASAEKPAPGLLWIHGGPGGQSRLGYRAMVQHLVNHGYAVLMVNNRGSSGYGKTFYHLDDRKHGEADLDDCVWARKYLSTLDWVDGERVGIMGGSYGGYMVAAALAFRPDAFDVGVNIFGVTNWLRTLESIPPWWSTFAKSLYDELGDPKTDAERLRRISPLFHASNIRKPFLVVQGANDARVLRAESDEIVAAVKANGVPVEYLLFDDEGHGFRKRKNRIAASQAYVRFLNKHLRDANRK